MTDISTRTLNILYEDAHILVCVKPHGVATQSRRPGSPDMESLLLNHLSQTADSNKAAKSKRQDNSLYLAVIHRLDQPVKGILVFAKTPSAARELNRQLQNQGFGKHYRALVGQQPPKDTDTLVDYIVKDPKTNTSRICTPETKGAKMARLSYQVVKKGQGIFNWGRGKTSFPPSPIELDIRLDTGRHHQIRVQLAHMGCPIIGDTKYNPKARDSQGWQEICLCAYRLEFLHPKTGKRMKFSLL